MTAAIQFPDWPQEQLRPILASIADLRRVATSEYGPAWCANLDDAMDDAASAFATANGWTLARTDIAPTALAKGHTQRADLAAWRATDLDLFEHADYFRDGSRGRLVGVVMHMYGPLRIEDVPDFITIDELPASWYSAITTAYLLRPSARR